MALNKPRSFVQTNVRWALEITSDQTIVRSKVTLNQAIVRSKPPMIRFNCARNSLISENFSLQTNLFSFAIIYLFQKN